MSEWLTQVQEHEAGPTQASPTWNQGDHHFNVLLEMDPVGLYLFGGA